MGDMADWIRDQDFDPVDETVSIEGVTAIHETDKALLCEINGDEHWIPKSQIDEDSEVYENGHSGVLVIPDWLAERRGLL